MRSSEPAPESIDILIVEDNAPLRAILRRRLEQEGYVCAEAEDEGKALALARTASPRCILFDGGMHGLNGAAVAREIRSDPRTCETRIHLLPRLSSADTRSPGSVPVFTNPGALPGLEALVRRLLGPAAAGVSGMTKAEAEEFLDWLEANGFAPSNLSYDPLEGFSIRSAPK